MSEDRTLYKRLKRLFSTQAVVRLTGDKQLRIVDTNSIQAFGNRGTIDRYRRVFLSGQGGGYSPSGRFDANSAFMASRLQMFRDYDLMDKDPIVSSVLDIYADESTIQNEFGKILSIQSEHDDVQQILHNLFYDILNIEFNLWPWTRNVAKYGDFFLYMDIHAEFGVTNVIPFSIYETFRVEGQNQENPFEIKFHIENDYLGFGRKDFDSFEIAHFRLLSDTNFLPYGRSMLEGARRIHKQLMLMEDAMLIHRITRASDKRKILVDVGNIPPAEVENYIERLMNRTKKVPVIDQTTGDYNLRYNMQNIMEDFYLPVRGKNQGTDIQNLQGLQFNAIEDIEYLRKKLLAAFKVPNSFIGYEEDINGKATLAAQDVRFARTIERIQRILVSELTKIAIVHLYSQGLRDEKLVEFELSLTNPSTIYEQEKVALWKDKISLANDLYMSKFVSRRWIYENILELAPRDIDEITEELPADVKLVAGLQAEEQKIIMQASQPPMPEGGAPEGGILPGAPEGEPTGEPAAAPEAEEGDPDMDELERILNSPDITEGGKVGRPEERNLFGTDRHPAGRDPFGKKQNRDALKRDPIRSKKRRTGLSELFESMDAKGLGGTPLVESDTTYLHESNIVDSDG